MKAVKYRLIRRVQAVNFKALSIFAVSSDAAKL